MLSCLLLALVHQGSSTFPALTPWAEMACPFHHPGPPSDLVFVPGIGALPISDGEAHGPSFGVWINTASLNLFYVPERDLLGMNGGGVHVACRRAYRSELAEQGKHSPGMPDGWIHEFDVYIPYVTADTWQPLEIVWPSGARQRIEPELADGKPTGKFSSSKGSPFVVRGVAGRDVNDWQSIRLQWAGGAFWVFAPHECGVMVLREIGTEQSIAHHSKFLYTKDRQLGEIRYFGDDKMFMQFTYGDDGLMTSVKNQLGDHVDFGYAPVDDEPGAPMELMTVTGIASDGKAAPIYTTYGYHLWKGFPLMTAISIPSPADNGKAKATSQVFYKSGEVTKVQDADGNSTEFTREVGGG